MIFTYKSSATPLTIKNIFYVDCYILVDDKF